MKSLPRTRGQPGPSRAKGARRGSYGAFIGSLAAILLVALGVRLTRTGLDILVLLILCAMVIALERTVGDWTADTIGPGMSAIGIMAFVGTGVWVVFATGKVDHFFSAADAAGYHTLYWRASSAATPVTPAPAAVRSPPPSSPSPLATLHTPRARSGNIAPNGSYRGTASETPERENRASVGTPRRRAALTVRIEQPRIIRAGESALIRAEVSAAGAPVPGALAVFTINGRSRNSTRTDEKGAASVLLMPRPGRSYQIHVQVPASGQYPAAHAWLDWSAKSH